MSFLFRNRFQTFKNIHLTDASPRFSPCARNGRFRTTYIYEPSKNSLSGTVQCDVHYYEDGNVRLTTRKSVSPTTISPSSSPTSATAGEIVKVIASLEGKYQKDLNHGFAKLSEGEFKALRRQLPVTRQKVEWEKVGGYRVSSTILCFY